MRARFAHLICTAASNRENNQVPCGERMTGRPRFADEPAGAYKVARTKNPGNVSRANGWMLYPCRAFAGRSMIRGSGRGSAIEMPASARKRLCRKSLRAVCFAYASAAPDSPSGACGGKTIRLVEPSALKFKRTQNSCAKSTNSMNRRALGHLCFIGGHRKSVGVKQFVDGASVDTERPRLNSLHEIRKMTRRQITISSSESSSLSSQFSGLPRPSSADPLEIARSRSSAVTRPSDS